MHSSSWSHPHTPHSESLPSSTAMFGAESHPTDPSYPSPAPTIESPHFVQHQATDQFQVQHHHSPSLPVPSPFAQVDSNIGPSRVLTRRQRAANEHQRRSSLPSTFARSEHDQVPRHHSAMYLTPPTADSRPQSPIDASDLHHHQIHRERLSLNMDAIPGMAVPTYHPLTPSSCGSSFSPYQLFPTHSRSNSSSTSMAPRSASPALSVGHGFASMSSSGSVSPHLPPFTSYSSGRMSPPDVPSGAQTTRPKRKQRLVNSQRKQICLDHMANDKLRQEDIALKYGVERSTVSKILKGKQKWLSLPDNDDLRTAKHRPSKFPDIEEQLVLWLEDCKAKGITGHLTDANIRARAKEVARNLHITEDRFKASSGWVENFKQRHGIRGGSWHGDGRISRMTSGQILAFPDHLLLSPVNPPINPTFGIAAEGINNAPSRRSADSPSPNQDDPSTTSMGLHPVWPESSSTVSRNPVPASSHQPSEPMVSTSIPPVVQSSDLATPSQHPLPEADRQPQIQYSPSEYSAPLTMYQNVSRIPHESPPTLADAEEAINVLIQFIDTSGHSILQSHERQLLVTIKCALFQAGSGVTFDRTQH